MVVFVFFFDVSFVDADDDTFAFLELEGGIVGADFFGLDVMLMIIMMNNDETSAVSTTVVNEENTVDFSLGSSS